MITVSGDALSYDRADTAGVQIKGKSDFLVSERVVGGEGQNLSFHVFFSHYFKFVKEGNSAPEHLNRNDVHSVRKFSLLREVERDNHC